MNSPRSQVVQLATLSTQVLIRQERLKVKIGTFFVILVRENQLDGLFIIVSRHMPASIFLIMKKLYRVGKLTTGHPMCRCLHYHVCSHARDSDPHCHLHRYWPCNPTSLMPFLHAALDHNPRRRKIIHKIHRVGMLVQCSRHECYVAPEHSGFSSLYWKPRFSQMQDCKPSLCTICVLHESSHRGP